MNVLNTWWSLVPPLIAIILALISKEVYSSLFIGILVGGILYSGFNLAGVMQHVFVDGMINSIADAWNAGILVFLVILGCMVMLMNKAGGSAAFGRWAAKNVVAHGLAKRCQIQLAYAIGVAKPVSIMVNSFGTAKTSDEDILKYVEENFDFRPAAIIKALDLQKPIYKKTAAYGHFGREEFAWEKIK